MRKLNGPECSRYEIYLDEELNYIALKDVRGFTIQWFDLKEWHELVKAVNDATKNIGV